MASGTRKAGSQTPFAQGTHATSDRPGVALLEKTDYAREHIAKP